MESKYHTARTVATSGIRVMIANGNRENILHALLTEPENTIHTEFIPLNS
jgi:glutamate 5-kinase